MTEKRSAGRPACGNLDPAPIIIDITFPKSGPRARWEDDWEAIDAFSIVKAIAQRRADLICAEGLCSKGNTCRARTTPSIPSKPWYPSDKDRHSAQVWIAEISVRFVCHRA